MRPSQVGNYELIRLLGVGGMAETYEAVRRGPAGFAQRVCLKRMLGHNLELDSAVELFLDEARLSALLRCGSIAQVIDFGEADGSYYIALELVEGENLETLLHGRVASGQTFSWSVVTFLAAELLSALDYAHTLSHEGAPLGSTPAPNMIITGTGPAAASPRASLHTCLRSKHAVRRSTDAATCSRSASCCTSS